eukprot:175572_1
MSFSFQRQPIDIYNDSGKRLYQREELLGQGTYGMVYKARTISTNEIVVIKQMKQFKEDDGGLPSTTLREVSLLKHLKHKHIVQMRDVFWTMEQTFCVVFELCWMDLSQYIDKKNDKNELIPLALIKKWSYQMIDGISYMHSHRILHRDLKPQNILLSHSMNIKIGDLGLGKEHKLPISTLTTEVVTLWYRSPELLLGATSYAGKIDIWSLGLIIVEMARNEPLFIAYSEWELLIKILQFHGTPNQSDGNSLTSLQHFSIKFPQFKGVPFESQMRSLQNDKMACNLLKKMLDLDPQKRYNAIRLLKHPWFDTLIDREIKKESKDNATKDILSLDLNAMNVNNSWDQYFELAAINIDTPKSTSNSNIAHENDLLSTIKISNKKCRTRVVNGGNDDVTLDIDRCDHCNNKHTKLMSHVLVQCNQNHDASPPTENVFGSRRVLGEIQTETDEDSDIENYGKPAIDSENKNNVKRKKPSLKRQEVELIPFQDVTQKWNAIAVNHMNDKLVNKMENEESMKTTQNDELNKNKIPNVCDGSFAFNAVPEKKRSRKEYNDENDYAEIEDVENIRPTKRRKI